MKKTIASLQASPTLTRFALTAFAHSFFPPFPPLRTPATQASECIAKLTSNLGSLQTLFSQQSLCKVHVKSVASVAGQIISLSSCVGSVTRIMTRHLFSAVNSAFSWDSEVFLSDDSISEINFWANNVSSLNGRVYWGVVQSLPVRISFSDACESACGVFVESDSELVFRGKSAKFYLERT